MSTHTVRPGKNRQDSLRSHQRRPLPFHPCLNHDAHDSVSRLHLPVAPKCNIHCDYCARPVSPTDGGEDCPGVTAAIISPAQALAKATKFLSRESSNAVVGVAGPGDPLANPETLETFRLIRKQHPKAKLCLCTNGFELSANLDELLDLGVQHLTVTINSIDPQIGSRIHPWVRDKDRLIMGEPAALLLLSRQLAGVEAAVELGMYVKINTVLIPEINEAHVEAVAEKVAVLGASVFNLVPLIPRGRMAGLSQPQDCQMKLLRQRCAQHLPVFDRCKQCRADAEGIPGRTASTVPTIEEDTRKLNRRRFLKASGVALGGTLATPAAAWATEFPGANLQVWSCGGLAEAFIPANKHYEELSGCKVNYTGAFAAALGKSLLGNAQTEVFAPRVLELARKLREQGKMLHFRPLCFTKYVLITPKGNPAGVSDIKDLKKPGVRTILSPGASPPGGQATLAILKKAGVLEGAQRNAVITGDCVHREAVDIARGAGDVAVVEQRITRLPKLAGRLEVIDIPEQFIPAKPLAFVIGVMKWAENPKLAQAFIDFILSEEGQASFEAAGFIPAASAEGQRLVEKHGVKDV